MVVLNQFKRCIWAGDGGIDLIVQSTQDSSNR